MPSAASSLFDGRRGAVSLSFDDGTASQIERAIHPLNERGLRGTFYLNPRDSLMANHVDRWRDVAATGHEIGNHTIGHPCPSAIMGRPGLEVMTIDEIETDIQKAQQRLITIAPHQTVWSFAYPCYATYVGKGAGRKSYVPVVAKHFLAGRAGGEIGFGNDPETADLAALHGMAVERLSLAETISIVERLIADGLWVILVLHDIGSGVLPVGESYYNGLLDFLVKRCDDVLTEPVVEVAARLSALQQTTQGD